MRFKGFYRYARIVVILLLVSFAIIHFGPDIKRAGFDRVIFEAMLLVQPILLLNILMVAIRYNILLGPDRQKLTLLYKAVLLVTGLSIVLPGKTSELLRPTYLKEHSKLPVFNSLMALGAEKVIDAFILGLLALVFISMSLFKHLWIVWVFAGCAPIAILAFSPKLSKQFHFFIRLLPSKVQGLAEKIYLQVCQIAKKGTLLQALVTGLIVWGLSLFSVYVFFYFALPKPLTFHQAAFLFILTTFGNLVPLLPAGFGLYEAGAIYALTKFGYKFDYALVLAICLHLSQLGLPVILGFVVAMCNKTGVSTLMKQGLQLVKKNKKNKKNDAKNAGRE